MGIFFSSLNAKTLNNKEEKGVSFSEIRNLGAEKSAKVNTQEDIVLDFDATISEQIRKNKKSDFLNDMFTADD